jgi:hypothetical protein
MKSGVFIRNYTKIALQIGNLAILLLISFYQISSANAALGELESSVQVDQTNLAANHTVTDFSGYRMYEITKNNLVVHEFVTSDGKVFAVTWKGPAHPDFSKLFGAYFPDYQAARVKAGEQIIRPRSLFADSGSLHIEYAGHMGALHGRAWIIPLLPQGFSTNEIR